MLTHELVHLQYRHGECQHPTIERRVRQEASRLLVPWSRLVDAVRVSAAVSDCADELEVLPMVLEDRLSTLTEAQVYRLRNIETLSA